MTRSLAGPASAGRLLARLLDEPQLAQAVRALDPRALGRLVNHLGLEDSGEILSLATTEQIAQVFDEDLWRGAGPGQDEAFDADRFALWLEVMLEAGDELTARRLTELDPDLVTLALMKQALVIDLDALAVQMADHGGDDDAELLEKALEGTLHHELGAYRVIARRPERWDAVLTALVALDKDHHDYLERLLERCCEIAAGEVEDGGGLYQVLTSGEMLESDVGADREQRRERQGYVAPSAATSFLNLARVTDLAVLLAGHEPDPITRAYFRSFSSNFEARPGPAAPRAPTATGGEPAASARLLDVLRAAEVLPPAGYTALLGAPADSEAPGTSESEGAGDQAARRLRAALQALKGSAPERSLRRHAELNYLVNLVISGCRWPASQIRPAEAAEIVLTVCGRGLSHLLEQAPDQNQDDSEQADSAAARAHALVSTHDAVKLFLVGWHLLVVEETLPAGLQWKRTGPGA